MAKQLEIMYLVYDLGWYLFMREYPYTEQQLRQLAHEMMSCYEPEELHELGMVEGEDFFSMSLLDVMDCLAWSCNYEVLEVSLIEGAVNKYE